MKLPETDFLQRNPIDENLALRRCIEPKKQPKDRGFSNAGLSDDAHPFAFVNRIAEMIQHFLLRMGIGESHIRNSMFSISPQATGCSGSSVSGMLSSILKIRSAAA